MATEHALCFEQSFLKCIALPNFAWDVLNDQKSTQPHPLTIVLAMAGSILKINILKILRELMFGEVITRLQTDTNHAETRRLVCFTIFRNGDWYNLCLSTRRIVIEYFLPQSLLVAGCRR